MAGPGTATVLIPSVQPLENSENILVMSFLDADAVVTYIQDRPTRLALAGRLWGRHAADFHPLFGFAIVLEGITNQVGEDLAGSHGVTVDCMEGLQHPQLGD